MKVSVLIAFAFTWSLGVAQAGTGFQIQDGDTIVGMNDVWLNPTHAGVSGEFRTGGPGTADFCQNTWWWYRIEGVHSREWAFANANGTTVSANTATTTFTQTEFDASILYTARETGQDTGSFIQDLTVTNTTTQAFTIHLYSYWLHRFVNPSSQSLGPNHMLIDESADFVYTGFGANAWQASTFPNGLIDILRDENADNFNNTGLPIFQDGFHGGFQWTLQLNPGAQMTVRSQFEQVPEPATLVGLGVLLLLLRRTYPQR